MVFLLDWLRDADEWICLCMLCNLAAEVLLVWFEGLLERVLLEIMA